MENNKSYRYSIFGLVVESGLFFPELIETTEAPSVYIRYGEPNQESGSVQFSFSIPDVALYEISPNQITIIPYTKDENLIRLFLLGSAFGAFVQIRGDLAFHGSAIEYKKQAILFSGASGVGKSTLAAAFVKQGFNLLSDDVCVIKFNHQFPLVNPSYPQIKLHEDSNIYAALKGSSQRILHAENKLGINVKSHFCSSALPLKFVYLLQPGSANTRIYELKGNEKFNSLAEQTYRPYFIVKLKKQPEHFAQISFMASSRVFRIQYAQSLEKINEVVKEIINHIERTNNL